MHEEGRSSASKKRKKKKKNEIERASSVSTDTGVGVGTEVDSRARCAASHRDGLKCYCDASCVVALLPRGALICLLCWYLGSGRSTRVAPLKRKVIPSSLRCAELCSLALSLVIRAATSEFLGGFGRPYQ